LLKERSFNNIFFFYIKVGETNKKEKEKENNETYVMKNVDVSIQNISDQNILE